MKMRLKAWRMNAMEVWRMNAPKSNDHGSMASIIDADSKWLL